MSRQIVLDTETTGLEISQDHRIIEIGCVELRSRRVSGNDFHRYVNPERAIDLGARDVHGLDSTFLADKPRFAELAEALWEYLTGAELIIHNASFDLAFLDAEFARAGLGGRLAEVCTVTDTLSLARKLHPGQRASLDALCKRYSVDNSRRDFHGALLDARLLAEVYLAMTGGQSALGLEAEPDALSGAPASAALSALLAAPAAPLCVIRADAEELTAHQERLRAIARKSGTLLWTGEQPA